VIEVPGPGILSPSSASVTSVSCASPGVCSAGGSYDTPNSRQAFVVNERDGTWGPAIEVPGTALLNRGGTASVTSVSCAPPGICSAGGNYIQSAAHYEAFVVSQPTLP
jgi:hypothetical protein